MTKATRPDATPPDHEPPRIAHATRAVYRDPDDPCSMFGQVDERYLSEACASHGNPPPKRRGSTDSDEYEVGKDYARPSNRRICMSYGATEQNVRDEERDCPVPLKRYRESLSRRAPTTDRDEIRALTDRIFGAIDYAIKENDVPHLLRAWVAGDEPGFTLLRRAFAPWVGHAWFLAILEGDPCDREFRRRNAPKARSAFRSAASVFAAAVYGEDTFGMSSGMGSLERVAESKGRTRATWDEIACKATRASAGGTRGLAAVDRTVDAAIGLSGLDLTAADAQGVLDAGAKLPLAERLLAYRARLAGWRCPPLKRALVVRVGRQEAEREAMLAAADEIRAATSHVTDTQIRKAIAASKARVEEHLRQLPAAGQMALSKGRSSMIGDEGQLHGLIPARDDRAKPARGGRQGAGRLTPTYFAEVEPEGAET